jgi:hypothetical protein
MSDAYDELPETVDRARIADAVREVIKSYLQERGISYKRLAQRVSTTVNLTVSDATIRLFVTGEHRGRVNAKNATLRALYNFIIADYHHFPVSTRSAYYELREDLGLLALPAVDDAMFAIGTHRWVHASKADVGRLLPKLEGTFVAIRRSTINSKYIKSLLYVQRARSKGHYYIKAEHLHFDRSLKLRRSAGFVFPVVRNLYMAMQVEGHEGLEIIVVRDPVQIQPEFFMGFMFGLNGNRNIYNSSILLERLTTRNRRAWDQIPPRFPADHSGLKHLGQDFLYRLAKVIPEERSQLLSRFEDEDPDT